MIMGAWCTVHNKFLIGWAAIQYHWTLGSSCLYLAHPSDSPKLTHPISGDIGRLPTQ